MAWARGCSVNIETTHTIVIHIEDGICQNVYHLPDGWGYEVVDTDEHEGQEEALARLEELEGGEA